jgi:hypothetical protein
MNMSSPFNLSEAASLEDLFKRMMSPDREACAEYQHMKVEPCFIDRIFVVYKPDGLDIKGQHRPPKILTQIKVTGFRVNAETGAELDLEDLVTRQVMTATYIPKRLFHYDAFVSVPPKQRLFWDAQSVRGTIKRTMGFHLLMKVRTKADFYSAGATAVETPTSFRALYPEENLKLIN